MKELGYGRIINFIQHTRPCRLGQPYTLHQQQGSCHPDDSHLLHFELKHFDNSKRYLPRPISHDMNTPIANTEEGKKFIVGATAQERWGELREIQGAALYLTSEAASYTTGINLPVDGGWTC